MRRGDKANDKLFNINKASLKRARTTVDLKQCLKVKMQPCQLLQTAQMQHVFGCRWSVGLRPNEKLLIKIFSPSINNDVLCCLWIVISFFFVQVFVRLFDWLEVVEWCWFVSFKGWRSKWWTGGGVQLTQNDKLVQ